MYKKILLPVDNSENSKRALVYVADAAITHNAEVLIVHTYEMTGELTTILSDDPVFHKMEEKLIEQSKIIAQPYLKELLSKGINASAIMVKGDVEFEIVKVCDEQNCDLIIIGSQRKKSLKSFLLGSISNYVVHHSTCPVLIVH